MAFDIEKVRWSTEMMRVVGLEGDDFPAAVPSGQFVREVPGRIAASLNLPNGVKRVSGGIEQACSALESHAVREGIIENSLGTVEVLKFTVDRNLMADKLRRKQSTGFMISYRRRQDGRRHRN